MQIRAAAEIDKRTKLTIWPAIRLTQNIPKPFHTPEVHTSQIGLHLNRAPLLPATDTFVTRLRRRSPFEP